MVTKAILVSTGIAVFIGGIGIALAHGDTHGAAAARKPAAMEQTAFGQTGDPKKVSRTITIDMDDGFHYTPANLKVKQGETIRIVARNKGKLLHEIVIGTPMELKEHAELMKKFPTMEHEAAYMAHVPPGKTEVIVWQFTKAGNFKFACLVAGHSEAGMVGDIVVN